MFSGEIRNDYPTLVDKMDEIEHFLLEHQERFIGILKPRPTRPERFIGQNGLNYIQNALFRSRALIEGAIQAFNNKNPLMAFLSIRAHYEITGGMAYFLKKLRLFYNQDLTVEQLEDILSQLILGAKLPDLKEAPSPVGVLSLIDAADDLYRKVLNKKESVFRSTYEWYCEFCHPNFFGITLGSEINSVGIVRYFNSPKILEKHLIALGDLSITAFTFLWFYDDALDLLVENEELPIIFCNITQ